MLGVGDGDNDAAWLSQIGHVAAPANARPSVRPLAAAVVGHHADDGVAAYLEVFFDLTDDAGR